MSLARAVCCCAATLLLAALSARTDSSEESSTVSRSSELVKVLRRQLMRDNSDYSLEAPGAAAVRAGAEPEPARPRAVTDNYYVTPVYRAGSEGTASHLDRTVEGDGTKSEHPVSKRDLLYYIDDDKLVSKEPEERRYKTLKVRRQFRRSAQDAFIREEGDEGVAIAHLSSAPFPELRQHRRARGAAAARDHELPQSRARIDGGALAAELAP